MRREQSYFTSNENDPAPLVHTLKDRVRFGEVDAMGIVWHGRYPFYFERSSAELCRRIGLTYDAYNKSNILAPLVQFHIDYFAPLVLDEEFTVRSRMVYSEGARINTEFLARKENGDMAVTGWTVQMFIDADSRAHILVSPPIWKTCQENWRSGKYKCLQNA